MLCCIFVLFVFVLCTKCCQFLWIVHFCLILQCSLTFSQFYDSLVIYHVIRNVEDFKSLDNTLAKRQVRQYIDQKIS
jgi:hypothetical protein